MVPPPDKQMIVARKLGEFLTSKKMRDGGSAITTPASNIIAAPASNETADECVLSEIPISYRPKAKKLMRAWSQKGMTWDDDGGNIYLKGKVVRRASLAQLLHHASSGRRRNPPTGFGHVTRYMAGQRLPSTVYANPRWRGEVWDKYTPSDSSTEYYTQGEWEEDTSTEKEAEQETGRVFPE